MEKVSISKIILRAYGKEFTLTSGGAVLPDGEGAAGDGTINTLQEVIAAMKGVPEGMTVKEFVEQVEGQIHEGMPTVDDIETIGPDAARKIVADAIAAE